MTPKIFESEFRFCQIVWDEEPINSTDLVKICEKRLDWKKSTTYTVIRRLAQRGVIKNENAVVTSLVSKNDAQVAEIDNLVEKSFGGSLPNFIAAFTKHKRLSDDEIKAIRQMIDTYEDK